jgi:hypothetical protein
VLLREFEVRPPWVF